MQLKYKTWLDSSTKHKPEFFVLFHPSEINTHFNQVAEDIFSVSNCVLWYSETAQTDVTLLKDMQLFIVLVSSALLNDAPERYNELFRYIKENNLFLIPLFCEKGLETKFNQCFGNIHGIRRFEQGPAREKYLAELDKNIAVFKPLETNREEILSAFEVNLFISYRKKDIAYLHQFVEKLQQYDYFSPIGIWYDHHLIAGEQFDDVIKEQLVSSTLFTLIITDNIFQEGNYVLAVEYPLALQKNKKVLGVSFSPSTEDLTQNYNQIHTYLDMTKDDFFAVFNAYLQLHQISFAPRTPRQNYLLGLAYLYGINTRRNLGKAVELLELAATENEYAAIEILTLLFNGNYGILQDNAKIADYLQKLLPYYRQNHLQEKYFDAVIRLSALRPANIFSFVPDAVAEITEAIDYFETTDLLGKKLRLYALIAKELHTKREVLDKFTYLNKAFPLLEDPSAIAESDFVIACAEIYAATCTSYYSQKGLDLLLKAVAVCEESTDETVQSLAPSIFATLAHHYEIIASDKAFDYYQKAIDATYLCIKNSIAFSLALINELSKYFCNLGLLYLKKEDCDNAINYINKAVNVISELALSNQDCSMLRTLSINFEKIGNIYLEKETLEKSVETYTQALQLSLYVNSIEQTEQSIDDILTGYFKIGNAYKKHKKYDKAIENLNKAIDYGKMAVTLYQTDNAVDSYTTCLNKLAHLYKEMGDYETAFSLFDKSGDTAQETYIKHPNYKNAESVLYAVSGLIEVSELTEKTDDVLSFLIIAVDLCADVVAQTPYPGEKELTRLLQECITFCQKGIPLSSESEIMATILKYYDALRIIFQTRGSARVLAMLCSATHYLDSEFTDPVKEELNKYAYKVLSSLEKVDLYNEEEYTRRKEVLRKHFNEIGYNPEEDA